MPFAHRCANRSIVDAVESVAGTAPRGNREKSDGEYFCDAFTA